MLRIAEPHVQLKALMFFVYLFFWIFEPLPVSSPVAEAGRKTSCCEGGFPVSYTVLSVSPGLQILSSDEDVHLLAFLCLDERALHASKGQQFPRANCALGCPGVQVMTMRAIGRGFAHVPAVQDLEPFLCRGLSIKHQLR